MNIITSSKQVLDESDEYIAARLPAIGCWYFFKNALITNTFFSGETPKQLLSEISSR